MTNLPSTLKADISGIMRRKIRQGVAEIYPGDRRLFERLLPLAESLHLPFAGWAEQRQQKVSDAVGAHATKRKHFSPSDRRDSPD